MSSNYFMCDSLIARALPYNSVHYTGSSGRQWGLKEVFLSWLWQEILGCGGCGIWKKQSKQKAVYMEGNLSAYISTSCPMMWLHPVHLTVHSSHLIWERSCTCNYPCWIMSCQLQELLLWSHDPCSKLGHRAVLLQFKRERKRSDHPVNLET